MSTHATDETAQIQRAWALCAQRRYDEAFALAQATVRHAPQTFEAWLLLAQLELRQERHEFALAAASNAAALRPDSSDAHYVLGRVHKARGDLKSAIACYRRAIEANPRNPDLLTSAGIALRAAGDVQGAVAMYRGALSINPRHAEANNNLSNALAALGATEAGDALEASGRRVLTQEFAALMQDIGKLRAEGRLDDAFECTRDAWRLAPQDAEIWRLAADLTRELGYESMSLPYYEKAAELDDACFAAVEAARGMCVAKGMPERAERHSRRVLKLRPSDAALMALELFLPAIQVNSASIDATRARYARNLERLLAGDLQVSALDGVLGTSAFYLAYHGRNDRALQESLAKLFLKTMPWLALTAPHCAAGSRRPGRIRLGILSRFLCQHSIGKTTRGLVERLSREHFEIFVLRIPPARDDDTARAIAAAAEHTITLGVDFFQARAELAALELDILFYQDIGMEPVSYFLAFARLAPVQCVSFGHPNTTGIPTMDYFLSNDLYETPDASAHYSEELFLLHDLPTLAYYHRPARGAERLDRAAFGLPVGATLYLCPQTLYKLHPDFDALLRGILLRDPRGLVVLIDSQFTEYTDRLRARFASSLVGLTDRVRFVPPLPQVQFLELLSIVDVVLDTVHFNGMNSSLEALAMGTPIVTLPTELQRGRHTQAMYRKMGVRDCIAADAEGYVDIAVRLGTDAAFARTLRERILASNSVLYENSSVVAECERFFRTVHERRAALRER